MNEEDTGIQFLLKGYVSLLKDSSFCLYFSVVPQMFCESLLQNEIQNISEFRLLFERTQHRKKKMKKEHNQEKQWGEGLKTEDRGY